MSHFQSSFAFDALAATGTWDTTSTLTDNVQIAGGIVYNNYFHPLRH
jgi:hypothetical protein